MGIRLCIRPISILVFLTLPVVAQPSSTQPKSPVAAPLADGLALGESGISRSSLRSILAPVMSVSLPSRAAGVVEAIDVLEGAEVKAGQPIMSLDSNKERAAVAQAEATVRGAKADMERAAGEFDRQQQLLADKIPSTKQIQEVQAQAAIARSRYDQTLATLDLARAQLADRDIVAPFDGIFLKTNKVVGEAVASYEPVARVVDISSLEMVVYCDARYFGMFKKGQKVDVRVERSAEEQPVVVGMVSHVDPVIDSGGAFRVKVKIEPSDKVVAGYQAILIAPQRYSDFFRIEMNPRPNATRSLRLESLETRTLLAADVADPYGLVADFDVAMHAVTGTGDYQASFSTNFGNHQLVLTGTSGASLAIDLGQLPAFITNLNISSFGSVRMTGTDHIDNLILTSIGSVTASGLNVAAITSTSNVNTLNIGSLGTSAVLKGSDMSLTATSLEGTTIFSSLQSLTLTSESKSVYYIAVPTETSGNDQKLNLTYVPAVTTISGIPNSAVHVVLPPIGGTDSPPTETNGDTNPGNANPGTDVVGQIQEPPSLDPSKLVIVNLALDAGTRALLEQLRGLLQSSSGDSQQRIVDLLNHANYVASSSANPLLANAGGGANDGTLHDFIPAVEGANALVGLGTAPIVADLTNAGYSADTVGDRFVPVIAENPTLETADRITVTTPIDVDVSWPIASLHYDLPESRVASATPTVSVSFPPPTLGESVRALGNYIVERVAAEFSPGQQSFVLLIDPAPSRKNEGNNRSAAESMIFGQDVPLPLEATVAA